MHPSQAFVCWQAVWCVVAVVPLEVSVLTFGRKGLNLRTYFDVRIILNYVH